MLILSVLTSAITEIIIGYTGIIPMFFRIKYGPDVEMWAGDGFGILLVYMYCLAGSSIGTIIACVLTIIRKGLRKLCSFFCTKCSV